MKKNIFILLILATILTGCNQKIKTVEYPKIFLKNYGDNKQIQFDIIKKDELMCLDYNNLNKLLFDISLMKLNLDNYKEQTNLYNEMFKGDN